MKREIKVLTSRRPNSTCEGFCLSFQARWPLLPTNSTPMPGSAYRKLTHHRKRTLDNRYTYMITSVMLARQITRSDAATPLLPITSLQTQQFHAITHSFAQRQSNIPIISNALRPLSVATWVAPPFHSNASSCLCSHKICAPFVFI